jgi:hypothetical protein
MFEDICNINDKIRLDDDCIKEDEPDMDDGTDIDTIIYNLKAVFGDDNVIAKSLKENKERKDRDDYFKKKWSKLVNPIMCFCSVDEYFDFLETFDYEQLKYPSLKVKINGVIFNIKELYENERV